jgi:tetratricopeptide (TPR) repeat protein
MKVPSFPRCLIGLALSITMFGPGLLAQGMKPGGGAGSRPSVTPGNQPNTTGPTTPDFSQHPLFLTGKVTMEDGTPPPDSTTIQLVCHSSPRTIGRTDPKGGFSIDLNNRAALMNSSDASENPMPSYGGAGPMGSSTNGITRPAAPATGPASAQGFANSRDLMGCDLQAALPGFRSQAVHLSNPQSLDDPNVGTIIMHRQANVEGTTISLTSALAPKDAKKAMERAQNFVRKQKWDEARQQLQKAVEIYPKFAVAWAELGRIQERQNESDGARKSFAMAMEADGKLVTPYLELAFMASQEKKWQEASDYSERALKLNPVDFPQAYMLNSMSSFYLEKINVAEKSARAGIDRDPEHHFPKMNELLGNVLMKKQDFTGAAEQFRKYLRYAPPDSDTSAARKQLAEIERSLAEAKKQ